MNRFCHPYRLCLIVAYGTLAASSATASQAPLVEAFAYAHPRTVKLFGGTIGRTAGYGTGIVVAPDGRIVTVLSPLLEAESLRAVLADGRTLAARVVRRDPVRQLALLEIPAKGLPHFNPGAAPPSRTGDWLLALGNPFKIADGPEPLSAAVGVCTGLTDLHARHRAQRLEYDGPAILIDAIVTVPGYAGGPLVDATGRLVGLVGRPAVSERTNTWISYALPAEQVARFLIEEPYTPRRSANPTPNLLSNLGLRLFDVGGRTRPAFVERVVPGSAAFKAGLRADDLILALNGTTISSCREFATELATANVNEPLALVVRREDEVTLIELHPNSGSRD